MRVKNLFVKTGVIGDARKTANWGEPVLLGLSV